MIRSDSLIYYRSIGVDTMRKAYDALESARSTAYQGSKILARLASLIESVRLKDSQSNDPKSTKKRVILRKRGRHGSSVDNT